MAVDTRSKRASSVNFQKPYILALPLPDGAISAQADRQHIVWSYSGIAALITPMQVTQAPVLVVETSSTTAIRTTQLPVLVTHLGTSSNLIVSQCPILVVYPFTGVCDLVEPPSEPPPDVETVVREIRRVRRAPHAFAGGDWGYYDELEIDLESGVGLRTGQGSDPLVMLRCSRDGGHTWENERTASAGRLGDYTRRVVFRRLGRARDMVFEIAVSDPVRWVILGARVRAKKGQH